MAREDKASARHYWLIVKKRTDAPEFLSVGLAEREYLPVFSFSEETEMFLKLGSLEEGWEAKEVGSGELLSLLFGELRGVERVAQDPLSGFPDDEEGMVADLVSVSRKRFMDKLLTLGRLWWVRGRNGKGRILD